MGVRRPHGDNKKWGKLEVPPEHTDSDFWKKALEEEGISARRGNITGLIIISLGVVLVLLGLTETITLTTSLTGWKMHLTNASPGVVLFIIGVAIIGFTHLRIIVRR